MMSSVVLSITLMCALIIPHNHEDVERVSASIGISSLVPISVLPVVIHVIHTGEPIGTSDNPSDSLIHAMVDLMNEAFRTDGPFYGGPDMEIEFQLAVRSPACTSTTGINRIDGSALPNYETGGITNFGYPGSVDEVLVKGLSRWPNTDYINIWIVNKINGSSTSPGGYAYFPEYNSALTDGIVLQASVVNGTNKTVIHELGHYFNLFHIYDVQYPEPDCENVDCSVDGDLICDTEPCLFTTNCNEPLNACTNDDWVIVDPGLNYTVLNNYMGFTNCQWMFTDDQKLRVHDGLESFRPGLLTSNALTLSDTGLPDTACTPTAVYGLSPFYGIERVEFGTLNVYSNTSAADAAFYFNRTCNQRVFVNAGENVFVRITASYQNYAQNRVYLDYDNDGTFDLPGELILSEDGGMVDDSVMIPLLSENICVPLRLRVVSDHPAAPAPGPCQLTGTMNDGVGQIEDYTVMILPRMVESVSSGDWDNPAIWSCSCVPGAADVILVQSGHTIDVPVELGEIECIELKLEPGSTLNVDNEIRVKGGCN